VTGAAAAGRPRIVLGSSSRYRAALLRQAGIPFEAIAPDADESVDPSVPCAEAVMIVARRKLASVAARAPDAIVIASDQVLEHEGRAVGKPGSAERAVETLLALAGREHRLLTSLVVKAAGEGGAVHEHLDVHRVTLRPLGREEARRYVLADDPVDCAGSIRIEARGILLVEKIEGGDQTAIVGLPMIALAALLRRCGLEPLTLI